MSQNTEYIITSTSQAFLQDSCVRSVGQEIGLLFGDSIVKRVDNDSKEAEKKIITQICIHSSAPILCYDRLWEKVMDNSLDYDFINELCSNETNKPNNPVGMYIFRRRSKLKFYLEDYILHRTLTAVVQAKYPCSLFPVCMIDQNDNSRPDSHYPSTYAFTNVFEIVDERALTKRISVKTVNMGDLALLEGTVMDNKDLIRKHCFELSNNLDEKTVHQLQENTFKAFSKAKDDYMKTANEYSVLKQEIEAMERALNAESACCNLLDALVIEQQFQLMSLNDDGSMEIQELQK